MSSYVVLLIKTSISFAELCAEKLCNAKLRNHVDRIFFFHLQFSSQERSCRGSYGLQNSTAACRQHCAVWENLPRSLLRFYLEASKTGKHRRRRNIAQPQRARQARKHCASVPSRRIRFRPQENDNEGTRPCSHSMDRCV